VRTKPWLTAFVTFAICTLLSSPALVAQPSPPAPAADGGAQVAPAQVYGKIMSNMEGEILGVAEAMPAEKYNFAPTNGNFQGVRTFGEQVKHLASANYEFFGGFGVSPHGEDPKAIDKLTNKDDVIKALQDSFSFAHRAVDTITAQNAFEELGANKSTRAGLATRALAHANDHYGQMVEYLRMNGIVPPASR
jgi:uncharacterized damage-inducible protein DinB